MIFFTLIEYFLIVMAFVNYKRGLVIFAIANLIIGVNVRGFLVPGGNMVSVENLLVLVYSVVYFIKRKTFLTEKEKFPFAVPFILIAVSWMLSSTITIAPGKISNTISAILRQLVIIYLYWKTLDRKSLNIVYYGSCIIIFLSVVYAQYEYIIQSNPIYDYIISSNIDEENVIDWNFDDSIERGYRVKSFFDHAISAGVMWALCFFWVIIFCSNSNVFKNKGAVRFIYYILMLLCILGIVYSRSRSGLVFVMVCMLYFVNFKQTKFYVYFALGGIVIGVLGSSIPQFGDIFMSIFSPKAADSVGGSSMDLRFDQLDAALSLFFESPVLGLGSGFQELVSEEMAARLMGYESMWFEIIPSYGLLGVFANLFLAYVSIIKIPKKYNSKAIKYVCLAYWIVGSLSSLPGFKMHYYYIIIFYLIKNSSVYNEKYEKCY